ncbi:MAG: hypothetical protein QGH60_19250 [Phycisphaerae bacterium]|nr:hypothetical protein [Phycisphaerae bacterium]
MGVCAFRSARRGVVFRPQNYRLYHAAVRAERSGRPGWETETPQDYWEPAVLQWASGGKVSSMTLRRIIGAGDGKDRDRPERLDICAGDRFRLVETSSSARGREIFRGYAGQGSLTIQANPDFESAGVVAYGPEVFLRRCAVTGAWYMTGQVDDAEIAGTADDDDRVRANVVATNLPVVFNEGGLPNAGDPNWTLAGETQEERHCAVFCAPGRIVRDQQGSVVSQGRHWDAYTALRSMIEWFDSGKVISHTATDWPAIQQIASATIGEVNVTGLDLLDAIRAVLLPAGLGFAIQPWAGPDGAHSLRVFRLHRGGRPGPYLGDWADDLSSGSLDAQRCSVQRLDFSRDNHSIANAVLVVGDRKRCEVSLEYSSQSASDLQPYWTSDDDLDDYAASGVVAWRNWTPAEYRTFCANYTYGLDDARKHPFRSFVWNEDGALGPIVQQIPDLSEYGAGGRAVRRPRPVAHSLSFDDADRTLPAAVLMAIAGDDDSRLQVPACIWPDRAGFTLTANTLHDWYPYATAEARGIQSGGSSLYDLYGGLSYLQLLYNTIENVAGEPQLTLRLIGSIESDECVTALADYTPDSSWPFRAEKVVFAPHRFKWRTALGDEGDSVDDSGDAALYASAVQDATSDAIGHGSIILRGIDRTYHVGDAISATRGREVNLRIGGRDIADAQAFAPVVIAVVWNFQSGAAKTELVLESPLLQVTR